MKIKRLLTFCLLLALVITATLLNRPIAAEAASYSSGFYYEVYNGKATITDHIGSATNLTIPSTLGGYPVTTIGNSAFYNCDSLTSVTIPDSVTTLDKRAFYNCDSLISVTIPNNVTFIGDEAFYNCDSLISVTIPNNVTFIGDKAFYSCGALTSVIIPDSVTTIGEYVFAWCEALTSVIIGDSITTIGNYAFAGCTALTSVTIGDSVTSISYNAFYNCKSLTSVTIPDSVTTIGSFAFEYCESLTSVTIGNSVTTIGEFAFEYCKSLTSVTIGNSVITIGGSAFSNCTNLISVTIPDSVITIGYRAFSMCNNLTDVYYAGNKTQWDAISGSRALTSATIHYSHIHDYTSHPVVIVEPTCAENGYIEHTCIHSDTYREILLALGHDYSEAATVTPPSCAAEGYTSTRCVRCGNIEKFDYTDKLAHELVFVSAVSPTCTESGWVYQTCQNCDYSSYTELSAEGHNYIDHEAKGPTCTESGWASYQTCLNCDYTSYEELPVTDHRYSNDICIFCGITGGTCGNNLTWTLDETGTLTISGTGAMYNYSYSSTSATQSTHPWNDVAGSIQAVVIEDGVTAIGNYAFSSCQNLSSVTICDSVESIGDYAFSRCSSLRNIVIPDSVINLGDGAFSSCYGLMSVTVSNSVESIGDYTFFDCNNLTAVAIGNSVKSIGNYAFADCDKLAVVTIPTSVESIDSNAFYRCNNLATVYYGGTQSQWSGLTFGITSSKLTSATIHFSHIHDYSLLPAVKEDPTCEEYGYIEYTCAWGETYRDNYVAPLGHATGIDSVVTGPTCTEKGYTTSTCLRCGETAKTEYTSALSHDYTGPTVMVEPTCAEQGYTGTICTRCNSVDKTNYTDVVAHKLVLVPAVAPTCEKTGLSVGTACQWCGIVGVAQKEVAALGGNCDFSADPTTCGTCGFVRAQLGITSVVLRPTVSGIYFKGVFTLGEGITAQRYGIAVSVENALPVADDSDPTSLYTNSYNSVLVKNILDSSNGKTVIYARAYILLEDGTYIYGDVVETCLYQVVLAVESQWDNLTDAQKTAIKEMYTAFRSCMKYWDIPKIKEYLPA